MNGTVDGDTNTKVGIANAFVIEQNGSIVAFRIVAIILDPELDSKHPSLPIAFKEDKPNRVVIIQDIVPVAGTTNPGTNPKQTAVKNLRDAVV